MIGRFYPKPDGHVCQLRLLQPITLKHSSHLKIALEFIHFFAIACTPVLLLLPRADYRIETDREF